MSFLSYLWNLKDAYFEFGGHHGDHIIGVHILDLENMQVAVGFSFLSYLVAGFYGGGRYHPYTCYFRYTDQIHEGAHSFEMFTPRNTKMNNQDMHIGVSEKYARKKWH